jgi:hypothetical protein
MSACRVFAVWVALLLCALGLSAAPVPEKKAPGPAMPRDPVVEQVVADGLKWLALHQAPDGHWGLHDFNKYARTLPLPKGVVRGDLSQPGTNRRNDTAGTAFGLLPFLAAGHTHKVAPKVGPDYRKTVNAGLTFLLLKQSRVGADRGNYGGDMYAHALATVAMCEAYGLTSDPRLKASAQAAIDYIVLAQDPVGGGWRYVPRSSGDTSMTNWHVMALKSAQLGKLKVPVLTLRKAGLFLDSAEAPRGSGGFAYTPGGPETISMTAAGLKSRQYLGVAPANPTLLAGIQKLRAVPPARALNLYYEFQATLAMYYQGGDDWTFWNLGPAGNGPGGIRDALLTRQDKGARMPANAGTWPGNDHVGGRLGATSLSLLMLLVPEENLPLFKRHLIVPAKAPRK